MNLNAHSVATLAKVYGPLREAWLKVAGDMLYTHGRQLQVASGLRTYEEQGALYAQGRTKPGEVVTRARPGQSWHNFGAGLDSCFDGPDAYLAKLPDKGALLWRELGRLGKAHGLEWGGDFKSIKDRPHLQLTHGMRLRDARAHYKRGGLAAVWAQFDAIRGLA